MTLLELQRKVAEAVTRPLTSAEGMQSKTADGKSTRDEVASFIKPNDRLSSFERLEIYNRQYWFRIISAFDEDFPALAAAVGPRAFERLTRAYLEDHPSRSFTLRNLGSEIESWLSSHPEFTGKHHALALDVARLEWAHIEAFDNGEERPLTLADMGQLGEGSQLSLQPHLRLVQLTHPVDSFVVSVHRGESLSSVASNAVTSTRAPKKRTLPKSILQPAATYLGVHRHDHFVYYKRLDREEYLLLRSLERGQPLGEALDEVFQASSIAEEERPGHVQAWFQNWAELGWFCSHTSSAAVRAARKRVN